MSTSKQKGQVDRLWKLFRTGGIFDPLSVIEQISFLIFARMLDMSEARNERRWKRKNPGKEFPGELFSPETQHLRWSQLKQEGDAETRLAVVRDELFPRMKTLAAKESTFGRYLEDAQLMIAEPSLLSEAVAMIDDLPLGKSHTKGDLYEYMLSKLSSDRTGGEYGTPRHIIDLMVQLVDPKPTETVCDPVCGTGGFLVQTIAHLMKEHSSPQGTFDALDEDGKPILDEKGNPEKIFTGDLLEPYRKHLQSGMLNGFDINFTMLRIAAMNLLLHDVESPNMLGLNTLSINFRQSHPKLVENRFDVILAHPPFGGTIDDKVVDPSLTGKVKTKKSELLFVTLIRQMLLEPGGRAAVIVPDGVLFGSSKAHMALRTMFMEENTLQGVISLPSGVFRPFHKVSTAILLFTRGGTTEDVFFYDLKNDGFSLDGKQTLIEGEELTDCRKRWEERNAKKDTDRKDKAFFVPKAGIEENDYDLSINRYKEVVDEAVEYEEPLEIVERQIIREKAIMQGLEELKEMLG